MNDRNNENLRELFEKFMDDRQAQNCLEDVQKAEEILREHPAPAPDDMLIANIKAEIAMRLPAKRNYAFRQIAYKVTRIAAAIIIFSVVGLRLLERGTSNSRNVAYASMIPTAIWESDDITVDDTNLAIFTAEIEQIEDELLALQLGEKGDGDSIITELEMELIAIDIDSDFWKE